MDHAELVHQSRQAGREWEDLLREYRKLGVNGVAVYEDVVQDLVQRGEILLRPGTELYVQYPNAGVKPGWVYLRSVKPGVAEALRDRYAYRTNTVTIDGNRWIGWPLDIREVPAGPDTELLRGLQAQGLLVVYRPYDHPAVRDPSSDWPDVPYVAFNGLKVVGADDPERFSKVVERLGNRVPAFIEANPQQGFEDLLRTHDAIRLFSIRPEWQDLLRPDEVASKFVLAARERSHRLLYVRPFQTVPATRDFLTRVQAGLAKADLRVGQPAPAHYEPNPTLRALSLIGPLLALALLAMSYPLPRLGALVALGTLGLVVAANVSSPFAAGALLAAVTFPALGFVLRRDRPTDWLIATGLSLVGVLFVAALGTDHHSMLGLEPFRGVSLTLIMPLGLFGLSLLPRQDIRKTIMDLYHTPVKLGDLVIIFIALAAIALVVLRRGNTPSVGVSEAEAKVRQALQDNIIRPRFKEIAGHPLAILALSRRFPPYFTYLLLLGGVVAQASILNTFAHFHTPLLISLQRALNGVAVGGAIGFLLLPALAWGLRFLRPARADAHAAPQA